MNRDEICSQRQISVGPNTTDMMGVTQRHQNNAGYFATRHCYLHGLGANANAKPASTIELQDRPRIVDAHRCCAGLAGPGLDVFDDEPNVPQALIEVPRVVLQPHHASGTDDTRTAMGRLTLDNVAAYFAGRPLLTPV